MTLAADAQARRVIFVTDGRDAKTIEALAADFLAHGCPPEQITSVSIDMSPAFIKGVSSELPNAQITFDKFHVIGHANAAVDKTRRIEQRTDKSLKGMRWTLLRDVFGLKPEAGAALHGLITDRGGAGHRRRPGGAAFPLRAARRPEPCLHGSWRSALTLPRVTQAPCR